MCIKYLFSGLIILYTYQIIGIEKIFITNSCIFLFKKGLLSLLIQRLYQRIFYLYQGIIY